MMTWVTSLKEPKLDLDNLPNSDTKELSEDVNLIPSSSTPRSNQSNMHWKRTLVIAKEKRFEIKSTKISKDFP